MFGERVLVFWGLTNACSDPAGNFITFVNGKYFRPSANTTMEQNKSKPKMSSLLVFLVMQVCLTDQHHFKAALVIVGLHAAGIHAGGNRVPLVILAIP